MRILRLSANRAPAARADETTRQAIESLCRQFRAYVEATLTELHARQQRRLVEDEWEVQTNAALALLHTEKKLYVITDLINGGLNRF